VPEQKALFLEFLSRFLGARVIGIQSGHGSVPDQILFDSPHKSTLCVPIQLLLGPMEVAQGEVRRKIAASERAFAQMATRIEAQQIPEAPANGN